jgi:hypothetical protein
MRGIARGRLLRLCKQRGTYVSPRHRSQPKTQTARRVGKIAWPTVDGAPCRRAIPGRRRGQVLPTRAAHVGTAREIFSCAEYLGVRALAHPATCLR